MIQVPSVLVECLVEKIAVAESVAERLVVVAVVAEAEK